MTTTQPPGGEPDLSFLGDLEAALRAALAGFERYNRAAFPARPPQFFALELAGEAGEVANDEKKAWKGRDVAPERLADEAADVFIALVNYANSRGIDLAAAVCAKVREIERRRIAEGDDPRRGTK